MRLLLFAIAFLTLAAASFGQPPANAPYLNPNLPPEQRAKDLVSRMTLEEKVLQMQNSAPVIPRLGVGVYNYWNEALHGVASGRAPVFPEPIGMGASFDPDLVHRVADAISTEARAKYHEAQRHAPIPEVPPGNSPGRIAWLTYWSPNINIFRDPRWGRGQETYGEDPYLTSRMGVAFVKGMQGDDPHYLKVVATPKHYAVHSGPEPLRHTFDAKPSEYDLVNTYLPAFKAAVTEGKADSVMCVYNAVDGVPGCASTDLLEKRLREQWGFQGFVVSDCGAIGDIFRSHRYSPTQGAASVAAVKAGTDLRNSDVAMVFVGLNGSQEGEGHDRSAVDLPEPQESLVKAMIATGEPLYPFGYSEGGREPPGKVHAGIRRCSENEGRYQPRRRSAAGRRPARRRRAVTITRAASNHGLSKSGGGGWSLA